MLKGYVTCILSTLQSLDFVTRKCIQYDKICSLAHWLRYCQTPSSSCPLLHEAHDHLSAYHRYSPLPHCFKSLPFRVMSSAQLLYSSLSSSSFLPDTPILKSASISATLRLHYGTHSGPRITQPTTRLMAPTIQEQFAMSRPSRTLWHTYAGTQTHIQSACPS